MERAGFIHDIRRAFRVTPVVAILGPRQCGKTTLARIFGRRRIMPICSDLIADPGLGEHIGEQYTNTEREKDRYGNVHDQGCLERVW